MSASPPQSSSPPPLRPPHPPPPPNHLHHPPPPVAAPVMSPEYFPWGDYPISDLPPPPHHNNMTSTTVIIICSILPFLVLFIVISLLVRCKQYNNEAVDRARRNAAGASASATAATVASRDEGKGLSVEVIAALPTFEFRRGEGGGGEECSICLVSVGEGEMVRALPQCMHLFHVDCIDQWFGSHKTCPCCRAEAELADPGADVYV